ncbi:uncharacterized protein LOC131659073 [Vicia villosa]|uniref:uncharacterized protein LOC131659073 n=1 Tax=Vicia villosa TaxID=3911 RepID=UPI00273AACD3|nr:uncharacterized protein LOC131659073 [Vicia villosa]
MRSARSNHQVLQIIRFLTGLNDEFAVVKSQILLMDPLPPMNKIFSMVIQHERQVQIPIATDESQTLINATDSKKFGGKQAYFKHGGNRVCTFCGKTNHTVENCFNKHGVPPHIQNRFQSTANNVTSDANDDGSVPNSADTRDDNAPMTQGQFNALMELLHKSILGQGSGHASSNQVTVGHSSACNTSHIMHHNHVSPWIIDSGATDHICSSIHWFHSYIKIVPISVKLPNGNCIIAKYSGQKTMRMTGFADQKDGLYYITIRDSESQDKTSPTHTQNSLVSIPSLAANIYLPDKALHRKLPYTASKNRVAHPYDLIHLDIWGPLAVKSIHGHAYFLIAVDECSRFTWITLMKSKVETRQHIINFVKLIENQKGTIVKTIRSDNGLEFSMLEFYVSKGIIHQTSCVESPQQNGRVERKHQHLLNVGRALLFKSKLPKNFWPYAILHATFIINKLPTQVLDNLSPHYILHNEVPDMHSLKFFGPLVYASTLHMHRTKLEPRGRKCVFLGFKMGMKGVVLYDINNHKVFVSRNVIHHVLNDDC